MGSGKRGNVGPARTSTTQGEAPQGKVDEDEEAASVTPDGDDGSAGEQTRAKPRVQADGPLSDGRPFGIVGIGASAGGLSAFASLLDHLPESSGLAFVLVPHLHPEYESHLSSLLSGRSHMPVIEVRQDTTILPDHFYILSPNQTMILSEGKLTLERRAPRGPNMPIDLLLRSLALELQERAIGVVLSGTGSDGTLGLEAIKAEGGFTFAQRADTAPYPEMPLSAARSGAVDLVLPPAEIAHELGQIAKRLRLLSGEPDGQDELQKIFSLLRGAKGVDFTNYRHTTIRRRIMRRMVLHKMNRLAEYVALLKERPGELDALYHDVLIRVTSFFRDPEVFDNLKEKVLPLLFTHKRPQNAPVRVWVPGCATGEEAYSLAMCLVEYTMASRQSFPIQIFATDISDGALEKARSGTYVENIALDVSADRLRRFFSRVGKSYQVSQSIRDMCIFARQNLTSDPPFSKLDLVSCRNVLIYLAPLLQKKVLPIFHYALKPGGFLLLGTSETTNNAPDLFEVVDKKHKIFVKTQASSRPSLDFPSLTRDIERPRPNTEAQRSEESDVHLAHREADRLALSRYAPPSVIVNQDLQIVEFRGQTGPFLEPAPGAPSHSLLRMAREGLAVELRAAIHKVQKTGEPFRTGPVEVRSIGGEYTTIIDVTPLRTGLAGLPGRYFLVSFEAAPAALLPPQKGKKGATRTAAASPAETRQVAKLKQELAANREYLQSVIEEMEATNEELQSANEEVISSNEELQSINEELETAKEELQSTNEELTTLNEELRARNSELALVNNDLHNALSSMTIPVIMVSADLRIRRFTPMAEGVLHLIPSDVGRPLEDIRPKIDTPDLSALVSEAIDGMRMVVRDVQDREGRWYSMRIRPYRTADNKIDGAVMALMDVSEVRRATAELDVSQHSVDALVEATHEPLLVLDKELRVRRANKAFLDTFDVTAEEGRLVYDLGNRPWNLPSMRKLLEEALASTTPVENHRIEYECAAGGRKSFLVNARSVRDGGGRAHRLVLAFALPRDIS